MKYFKILIAVLILGGGIGFLITYKTSESDTENISDVEEESSPLNKKLKYWFFYNPFSDEQEPYLKKDGSTEVNEQNPDLIKHVVKEVKEIISGKKEKVEVKYEDIVRQPRYNLYVKDCKSTAAKVLTLMQIMEPEGAVFITDSLSELVPVVKSKLKSECESYANSLHSAKGECTIYLKEIKYDIYLSDCLNKKEELRIIQEVLEVDEIQAEIFQQTKNDTTPILTNLDIHTAFKLNDAFSSNNCKVQLKNFKGY